MTAHSLTQARLKELLHYNPDTGIFTRRIAVSNTHIGDVAGTICDGYVVIRVDGSVYKAHRLAILYIEGALPSQHVDHENHIRSDNAWSNLHRATRIDNMRNTKKRKDNTSGTTGVHWNKRDKLWYAGIGGKYVGAFKSKADAITARVDVQRKHKYHANHGKP